MIDQENIHDIRKQINAEYLWLEKLFDLRKTELEGSKRSFSHDIGEWKIEQLDFIPDLEGNDDTYSLFALKNNWKIEDRVLVLLALSNTMRPLFLRELIAFGKEHDELDFTLKLKLGDSENRATFQLALWLLLGREREEWYPYYSLFSTEHTLFKHDVLRNDFFGNKEYEFISELDLPLIIRKEFFILLTTGKPYEPKYSTSFPASKLETHYNFDDLLLDSKISLRLKEAINWMKQQDKLKKDPNLNGELKGFKAIFFGPPGTGKTMSVRVIGKELNKTVYRIDLSRIVSKYVGETEKNLKHVFDVAEQKDWILFFDEGDALFGKRSSSKSSQDRYANQEVSYLLQRMEEYPGIILLATNKKNDMDPAFIRRFQSNIFFPKPDPIIRLALLKKAYSKEYKLEDPSILKAYADRYEITGADIINIKHFSIVQAMSEGRTTVTEEMLRRGLELELEKTNRSL